MSPAIASSEEKNRTFEDKVASRSRPRERPRRESINEQTRNARRHAIDQPREWKHLQGENIASFNCSWSRNLQGRAENDHEIRIQDILLLQREESRRQILTEEDNLRLDRILNQTHSTFNSSKLLCTDVAFRAFRYAIAENLRANCISTVFFAARNASGGIETAMRFNEILGLHTGCWNESGV